MLPLDRLDLGCPVDGGVMQEGNSLNGAIRMSLPIPGSSKPDPGVGRKRTWLLGEHGRMPAGHPSLSLRTTPAPAIPLPGQQRGGEVGGTE